MDKTIKFDNSIEKYRTLADERGDDGDFIGSLGFLYSALNKDKDNEEVIADIADTYADMGLYELSNDFWFKYLDKAPERKASIAYEELAINYFYLDNLWLSGFYFHKKVEKDGFISPDGLDKEIVDFISETVDKKESYHIAYPFDRADYSHKLKIAKRALSLGDFKTASAIYDSVPNECMDETVSDEVAVSYFLSKQDDKVLEVCKDSLSRHGDNVSAYSNLSTLYKAKGDDEKSAYYYKRALESRKNNRSEVYKLATVAIEQQDNITARDCIGKILEERPFDAVMIFFYGISMLNTGDYKKAYDILSKARRINPDSYIYEYYLKLADKLIENNKNANRLLPVKYALELPQKVERAYKKEIKDIIASSSFNQGEFDIKKYRDILRWGIRCEDKETAKQSAFILCADNRKESEEILLSTLLNTEVGDEVKRIIVYTLVERGYKERFGIEAGGGLFTKIKPRKLLFEKEKDGAIFVSAYAICLAKSVLWDIEDKDKIGFSANKVYSLYKEDIKNADLLPEEISAIIICDAGYKLFPSDKAVCGAFGVKYARISEIIKKIKGE